MISQSCITEDQKYQGALYREKKKPQSRVPPAQQPSKPQNSRYQAPYVQSSDTAGAPTPESMAGMTPQIPPPCPTPPEQAAPPINVNDFLVEAGSPPREESDSYSDDSDSSSDVSSSEDDDDEHGRVRQPTNGNHILAQHHDLFYPPPQIVYGAYPVTAQYTSYPSQPSLDIPMPDVPPPAPVRTPSNSYPQPLPTSQTAQSSDKKRKRQLADLDIAAVTTHPPVTLATGLTAGLTRMITEDNDVRAIEASPLSPKKRSKSDGKKDKDKDKSSKSKDDSKKSKASKNGNGDQDVTMRYSADPEEKDRRGKKHRQSIDLADGTSNGNKSKKDTKAIEGTKDLVRVEQRIVANQERIFHHPPQQTHSANGAKTKPQRFLDLAAHAGQSHITGQSLWGALKMFNEDLRIDGGAKEKEQKKLFKALRMGVNDRGEIVLFTVPAEEKEKEGRKGRR
ncbi:hypothetical protein MRB53_041717 [Persea americana]|nr:hypothetical protein MRB53_041717 [Persea americana]